MVAELESTKERLRGRQPTLNHPPKAHLVALLNGTGRVGQRATPKLPDHRPGHGVVPRPDAKLTAIAHTSLSER